MNDLRDIWGIFQGFFRNALVFIADSLSFLGGHKWAGAIVLLTLVVRSALLPLAIKQVRSSRAMQRLQPEIKRLQARYRDDRQKLNEEMMDLYRREGVNPFAGCLPVVAQMPVFIAMFYAIREVNKIPGIKMPFLGLGNLALQAKTSAAGIILLAIMTVFQYLSTRQITAGQDAQQARLMRLMPLLFIGFMINFPAGLVLYWATSNVFAFVQQWFMLRGHVQVPAPKAKERPKAGNQQQASRDRLPSKPQNRSKDRPKARPPVRTKPRSKRR